jgi:hypothetical protein
MDDVLMGEARVDLIKLDVEGAELFALRGAEQVIRRTKPILFIEMLRKWTARYDYSPNDIIAFMKGLGYCCLAVEEDKLRELERMSDTEAATNFFFLHREAHRSRCESLLNSI